MFVVVLTYVKPLAEIDRHMREHMRFLREQYAAKTFIASGRQVPRTGGVILARAASKEALAAIMQQDPFFQHGAATFEILEFRTSQHDPAFAPFADEDTR
ncbi:MAG TPA: YciI family protein [Kofleriaceae bacterium]|nr:YciI family protein [Kofleriaceae bacterium]